MKRSHLTLVVTLLAVLSALPPRARAEDQVDPKALAKARDVVAASVPPEQQTKMMGAITEKFSLYVASANPGREVDVDQLVQTYFVPVLQAHFGELADISAKEFARDFSLAELDRLLAFYRSDLGRKLVDVQGKLDPQIMEQGPAITQRIVAEALQKMAPDMQKKGLVAPIP